MKKTIITTMTIICIVSITAASVYADSRKRHRHQLEGFIFGTGAGFLGATIMNKLHHKRPKVYVEEPRHKKRHYAKRHRRDRRYRQSQAQPAGYWKVKKEWVPEEYVEKWNPGHYNKRGKWVGGRLERFVVREGYWEKRRVWVSYY